MSDSVKLRLKCLPQHDYANLRVLQAPFDSSADLKYQAPTLFDTDVLPEIYRLEHGNEKALDHFRRIIKEFDYKKTTRESHDAELKSVTLDIKNLVKSGDAFNMPSPLTYCRDLIQAKVTGEGKLLHPDSYFQTDAYKALIGYESNLKSYQWDFPVIPQQHDWPIFHYIEEYNRRLQNGFVPRKREIKVQNAYNVPLTLYGAIIGDIVGSPYEFPKDERIKTTEFEFISDNSRFTDDTVCTVAIANAIYDHVTVSDNLDNDLANMCKSELISVCNNHHVSYGNLFHDWLIGKNLTKSYNSFGNGSAMRVSACGIVYDTLYETLRAAEASSLPTHNHPEGIKGAQAVAEVMWRIRHGATKDEIRSAIEFEYGYDLHRSLDDIRPNYKFDATCQGSVPESIIAFLEGNSFEECVRLAVSLGGDTDTQAAITGAMASMMYKIPERYMFIADEFLPDDLRQSVHRFNNLFGNPHPYR